MGEPRSVLIHPSACTSCWAVELLPLKWLQIWCRMVVSSDLNLLGTYNLNNLVLHTIRRPLQHKPNYSFLKLLR